MIAFGRVSPRPRFETSARQIRRPGVSTIFIKVYISIVTTLMVLVELLQQCVVRMLFLESIFSLHTFTPSTVLGP
jgi:hypothetical protein